MKIDFTKEEYGVLLDMLSIADTVIFHYAKENESPYQDFIALRNKLFSYFTEMKAQDKIGFDDETNMFHENPDYEHFINNKFIIPFMENTFWCKLIEALAERDVKSYNKLDIEEQLQNIAALKDQYKNEFLMFGIKNLKIKRKDLMN